MIIDFSVENFKSIKDEQTFSMLVSDGGKDTPDNIFRLEAEKNISLLKIGLIYGANASGKSNLILALEAFRHFIVNSTDLKLEQPIPYYDPYRLDKNYPDKPSIFGIEFVGMDKIRYRYSVSFTKEEVILEELLFYPNKQEARLFRREKGKSIKFGHHFKGRKKSIEQELIANNLFLSKAANSNHEQMQNIYLHLKNELVFYSASPLESMIEISHTLRLLKRDERGFNNKLENMLVAADTGIQSVGSESRNVDNAVFDIPKDVPEHIRNKLIEDISYKTITYHKMYDGKNELDNVRFNLDDESEGTVKMFSMAGYIIPVLENGHTLLIDELDRSLHPHLCEFIIHLFNNPDTNPKNAQLIATTHDATLLNPKNLRRDQIWFTDKNLYGATELFSLDEFNKNEVRKNTPFDKWYLEGRFGAIPRINWTLFRIDD